MRFGFVHRVMTNSLAIIGLLSLVLSGKLNLLVSAVALVGLVVALALPDRFKQETFLKAAGVVAPIFVLLLQLGRLALGSDPIPIVIEFAVLLQVVRLLTRRGAVHDHQVILLALLHLVAGTILGGGLTYALALVGFLVLTPGALVLSHLRREVEGNYRQGARDRTGMPVDVPRILRSRRVIDRGFLVLTCLLSLPVFLFTAMLFVMFPRVGLSWLMVPPVQPERMVGFSERVDLGGVGTIRSDPTPVMRVRPDDLPSTPPLRRNLYLRGAVFDTYDGRSWLRSPHSSRSIVKMGQDHVLRRLPRDSDRTLQIELEPIQPTVVFLPGEAVALNVAVRPGRAGNAPPRVYFGSHGELRYASVDQKGLDYEVYLPPEGLVTPERMAEGERARYLSLPADLSPKIRELARELATGKSKPFEVATALETALRKNYSYDLNSPSGGAPDPLEHFLFESKRGHCEFYSTAMAMMLRVNGVPSRNVTGFVGGTYNRFGEFYAVRQGDAHSWVEAYLPRLGWRRFDPTPPASALPQASTDGPAALLRELMEATAQNWDEYVEGYDLEQQVGLVRGISRGLRQIFHSGDSSSDSARGGGLSSRRLLLALLGVACIVAGLLAYRRGRKKGESPEQQRTEAALRTIDLYRRVESALKLRGVPRPAGTPPLTHARALQAAGHPAGEEAVALTEIYVELRFGQRELTASLAADYRRRAQALRKRSEVEQKAA